MDSPFTSNSSNNTFIPPAAGASRSPCPALNALANHGYINRDGHNIAPSELIFALQKVYNVSTPLAVSLTYIGMIACGRSLTDLDLHDLARHDVIEHDASLCHDDAPPDANFAPTEVDHTLVSRLLTGSTQPGSTSLGGLSLRDLAKARMDRELSSQAHLSVIQKLIAAGEASMTWLVMKDEHGVVPSKSIEQWYGEERLPDGFRPPVEQISLSNTHNCSNAVSHWIESLQSHADEEQR